MELIDIAKENLQRDNLLIVSKDHTDFNYKMIAENEQLIIDSRNAFEKNNILNDRIFKA